MYACKKEKFVDWEKKLSTGTKKLSTGKKKLSTGKKIVDWEKNSPENSSERRALAHPTTNNPTTHNPPTPTTPTGGSRGGRSAPPNGPPYTSTARTARYCITSPSAPLRVLESRFRLRRLPRRPCGQSNRRGPGYSTR